MPQIVETIRGIAELVIAGGIIGVFTKLWDINSRLVSVETKVDALTHGREHHELVNQLDSDF